MRNIIKLFVFISLFSSTHAFACDVCGNYMGITPYDNQSMISFLHRYRVFNGYRNYQSQPQFFPKSAYRVAHGSTGDDDTLNKTINNYSSNDFESFKIFELRFKYFVMQRLELNAFLPLVNNKSKHDQDYIKHTGLGDASINVGYHLITPKSDKKIRSRLILGAGFKLPTGNFLAHDKQSNRMPFELQGGSGGIDGLGNLTYVLMSNKLGGSISLNYKVNGENRLHEKLGNSQNHFGSIFYRIECKKLIFYPSVQANYEFTKGLYVKDKLQKNTEVNSLLLGPGLDIYYKAFSLNTSWQFTAMEKVFDGNLKSVGRFSIGLNYSFVKKDS